MIEEGFMMCVREHGSLRESELLYGVITGGNEGCRCGSQGDGNH